MICNLIGLSYLVEILIEDVVFDYLLFIQKQVVVGQQVLVGVLFHLVFGLVQEEPSLCNLLHELIVEVHRHLFWVNEYFCSRF